MKKLFSHKSFFAIPAVLVRSLPHMSPYEMIESFANLTRLTFRDPKLLVLVEAHVSASVPRLPPTQLLLLVTLIAQHRTHAASHGELLAAAAEALVERGAALSNAHLARLCTAVAAARFLHTQILSGLAPLVEQRLAEFDFAQLAALARAYALAGRGTKAGCAVLRLLVARGAADLTLDGKFHPQNELFSEGEYSDAQRAAPRNSSAPAKISALSDLFFAASSAGPELSTMVVQRFSDCLRRPDALQDATAEHCYGIIKALVQSRLPQIREVWDALLNQALRLFPTSCRRSENPKLPALGAAGEDAVRKRLPHASSAFMANNALKLSSASWGALGQVAMQLARYILRCPIGSHPAAATKFFSAYNQAIVELLSNANARGRQQTTVAPITLIHTLIALGSVGCFSAPLADLAPSFEEAVQTELSLLTPQEFCGALFAAARVPLASLKLSERFVLEFLERVVQLRGLEVAQVAFAAARAMHFERGLWQVLAGRVKALIDEGEFFSAEHRGPEAAAKAFAAALAHRAFRRVERVPRLLSEADHLSYILNHTEKYSLDYDALSNYTLQRLLKIDLLRDVAATRLFPGLPTYSCFPLDGRLLDVYCPSANVALLLIPTAKDVPSASLREIDANDGDVAHMHKRHKMTVLTIPGDKVGREDVRTMVEVLTSQKICKLVDRRVFGRPLTEIDRSEQALRGDPRCWRRRAEGLILPVALQAQTEGT